MVMEEVANPNTILSLKDKSTFCYSDMMKILEGTFVNQGDDAKKSMKELYSDPSNWPNQLTLEIPIFREGRFEHWWYGELNFTTETLNKMITNFNNKVVPHDIAFDMEHDWTGGALAWVQEANGSLFTRYVPVKTSTGEKDKNVLFARCDLNLIGIKKVLGKEVRYFSSEIDPDYSTNEVIQIPLPNGSYADTTLSHGETLVGGGFTNRPFIPGMAAAAFSNRGFSQEGLKKGLKFNDTQAITLLVDDVIQDQGYPSVGSIIMFSDTKGTKQFEKKPVVQVPQNIIQSTGNVQSFSNSNSKRNNEGDKNMVTLSDLLSQVQNMNIEDKFKKFNEAVGQIQESDRLVFNMLFASTKEAMDQKDIQKRLAHEAELARQEVTKLSDDKKNLELNLVKVREQSWTDRVSKAGLELSQKQHHTAVINEFTRLFSAMPEEARVMKFSLDNKEFSFMDMVSSILEKIPSDARMTTEFTLSNHPNKDGVNQVDPNKGAVNGDPVVPPVTPPVNSKFSHVDPKDLAKVQKYSQRYPSMPVPDASLIPAINDDGVLDTSLLK